MDKSINREEVTRQIRLLHMQGLKCMALECINSGFNTANQVYNKTLEFTRQDFGFDTVMDVLETCESQQLIECIPDSGRTYKITPTGEHVLENLKFWHSMYADINPYK